MGNEVIACPECGKNLNVFVPDYPEEKAIGFVSDEEIDKSEYWEVHEAVCPEEHSVWYTTEEESSGIV